MPGQTTVVTVFTLTEAAKRLGVSRWTLGRAIRDGKLTAHRVGTAQLIYASDLLDYVLQYRGGKGIETD